MENDQAVVTGLLNWVALQASQLQSTQRLPDEEGGSSGVPQPDHVICGYFQRGNGEQAPNKQGALITAGKQCVWASIETNSNNAKKSFSNTKKGRRE